MKSLLLLLTALLIDVGTPDHREKYLGYGWSRNETTQGRNAAWIKRMEADVFFDSPAKVTQTLKIDCQVFPVKDKQQNVGIYLNGKFIAEQLCKDTLDFQTLTYTLPAAHFVNGRNRLIIRLGYLARPSGDGRKVGLFVDKIELTPKGEIAIRLTDDFLHPFPFNGKPFSPTLFPCD